MVLDRPRPRVEQDFGSGWNCSMRRIEIVARGGAWAVKHGDGYLGVVPDEAQARSLAAVLREQPAAPVRGSGRDAILADANGAEPLHGQGSTRASA